MLARSTALVLIDVQKGFDNPIWGQRNNMGAEAKMAQLLNAWRSAGMPVFHIRHLSGEKNSPFRPDQMGCEFKDAVKPRLGEPVIQKQVNSAFIGTALEYRLLNSGVRSVVLAGFTTDHCVSTTARMAANLGFETLVVSDATATFERTGPAGKRHSAEEIHELALVSLHQEFASIIDTESLLEQLSPTEVLA